MEFKENGAKACGNCKYFKGNGDCEKEDKIVGMFDLCGKFKAIDEPRIVNAKCCKHCEYFKTVMGRESMGYWCSKRKDCILGTDYCEDFRYDKDI